MLTGSRFRVFEPGIGLAMAPRGARFQVRTASDAGKPLWSGTKPPGRWFRSTVAGRRGNNTAGSIRSGPTPDGARRIRKSKCSDATRVLRKKEIADRFVFVEPGDE